MKRLTTFLLTLLLFTLGASAQTDYSYLMSTDGITGWTNASNMDWGVERYDGNGFSAGKIMYQTITGLPAGTYTVKFYAFSRIARDNALPTADTQSTISQGYAQAGSNDAVTQALTIPTEYTPGHAGFTDDDMVTLTVTLADGESLEYGIQNATAGGQWYGVSAISLVSDATPEAKSLSEGDVVETEEAEGDHWKIVGSEGASLVNQLKLNTWSSEADPSGMKVPFVQYWKGTSAVLDASTIKHYQLGGLPAGTYTVTIDARAFNEGSLTDIATGTIFFTANDASVDLATGTHGTYNGTSADLYGTYTLEATVGEAGTLDIGFTILANSNSDWLAFKNLSVTFVEAAPTVDGNDNDYEIGDEVTVDRKICTIVGDNLFVNGGFGDGMNGWTAGGYTTAADPDNFNVQAEGGYNDGAYLVASSAGTGNEKTPSQAIAVEVGKSYMLVAYTSGKTPDSGNLRYSALFEMSDATTEASHTEGSTNYSNTIVQLEWGADPGVTTDEWTQTIGVFEATTDYVGMRMGWSGGSYDGFQLYEVEVEEIEPEYVYETVYECVADGVDWQKPDHWTAENDATTNLHINTHSTEADPSGMVTPFVEYWYASGTNLPDDVLSHDELVDLEAGEYEVTIEVRAFNESGTTAITAGTTFNANGVGVDLTEAGLESSTAFSGHYELYGEITVVTEVTEAGTMDINFTVKDANYNWLAFKNLKVAMRTSTADIELTAVEGPMNAEVQAAMEDAIAAFDASLKADDYYAAVDAIEAAEASVAYYAPIVAAVDALDDAGAATWAESDYAAALADRTLTNEDVSADLAAAQKAQTTAGSDMTYVALYDGDWNGNTGTYQTGVERYGDEIEVEDETVKVLYKTIEDLTPGTYEVTFYAVANNAWVGAAFGDGIAQVFANDEVVDVTVYDQTACTLVSEEYLYTITCTVGDDGVLEFGLQNIATGGNWYVAQAISLTLVAVEGEEPEPAGIEGDYLIVDAEGNYLGGGLVYGTQAATIGKPQFINFEVQEDGTYHLDSHQYNNASAHYLGSNLYFDNATPVDWTIEAVDGGYTIYGTVDTGTGYLTSNGFQTEASVEADPYVWTLVTIDDVIAGMDEATADAPVDVTALIDAPELKRNSNSSYYPTWTVTGYDGTGTPSNYAFGGSGAVTASCAESYHSTNGFNFSQEITLPLAGTYTLSAQGFYRDDNSTTLLLPVMYVDDQTSTFPEITRTDEYLGVADNMANAYQEFLLGLHPVDAITITAEEDGETVTIGFKGEDTSLWQIMGELTLLYSGSEEVEPEPTPEPTEDGTYAFVCTDWSSIDLGRVTDDNITYDEASNTITVNAGTGDNNVALSNGREAPFTTAEYTISEDQIYFTVIATNISTASGASQLWWMNGYNNGMAAEPDQIEVFVDEDGNENGVVLLAWDISAYVTAGEDGMITLDGWTGFGLTSTTGTSVISDINFYTATELNGVVTAIGSVKADKEPAAAEGIYTLSGVRLNKITKSGIYIVNGKKVLVK